VTALAYATITADLGEFVAAASGPPTTGDLTGAVVITCDAEVAGYASSLAIPGVGIRENGPYTVTIGAGGTVSVEVVATGQTASRSRRTSPTPPTSATWSTPTVTGSGCPR